MVSELRPEGADQLDITVVGADADRNSLDNILQVPVPTTQVARFRLARSPPSFRRARHRRSCTDRQRVISVSAITTDRPIGDIVQDMNLALAKTTLPPGYRVVLGGQAQQLNTRRSRLAAR